MILELIDSKTKDKFTVVLDSDSFKINKIDFCGYSINDATHILSFYNKNNDKVFEMNDAGLYNVKMLDDEIEKRSTVIYIGK